MYILKNAIRSIVRSKGRNILIGIIALVIAVSSCVALTIKQSANKAQAENLANLEITGTISVDRSAMMKNAQGSGQDIRSAMSNVEDLSLDEMLTYAKSEYVKSFYYTISSSMDAGDSIEAYDTSTTSDSSTDAEDTAKTNDRGGMPGGGGGFGMGTQGDFTVIGYNAHSSMTNFVSGTCKITDGVIFDEDTSEPVCVISSELALLNDINVGDTISLVNPNDTEEIIAFTVSGIYTNSESSATTTDSGMRGFSASSDPANRIYTSYNALKAITTESKANATTATDSKTGRESSTALREQVSGTYTFQDVDHYESFQKDVTAMGLSDDYTVSSSDLTSYEASLVPLKNLSTFAGYFLLVVLLIGGIILIVFNIFNIRERKYEIGVLTAIGMKKGKVAVQFVCELFVVTFIAIFIGTGVGAVISVPVANTLLASQIASQQEQQSEKMANFGGKFGNQTTDAAPAAANAPSGAGMRIPGMSSVTDYVSDISATIDILVILQLMAIGVLLTIVSSCAAVTSVLRYEPLKILTNRA